LKGQVPQFIKETPDRQLVRLYHSHIAVYTDGTAEIAGRPLATDIVKAHNTHIALVDNGLVTLDLENGHQIDADISSVVNADYHTIFCVSYDGEHFAINTQSLERIEVPFSTKIYRWYKRYASSRFPNRLDYKNMPGEYLHCDFDEPLFHVSHEDGSSTVLLLGESSPVFICFPRVATHECYYNATKFTGIKNMVAYGGDLLAFATTDGELRLFMVTYDLLTSRSIRTHNTPEKFRCSSMRVVELRYDLILFDNGEVYRIGDLTTPVFTEVALPFHPRKAAS